MTKDTFDSISFQQAHELDCKRKPLNCPKNCGAVVPREEVRTKCCYYCSPTGGHFAWACVNPLNDNSVGASNLMAGNRKLARKVTVLLRGSQWGSGFYG